MLARRRRRGACRRDGVDHRRALRWPPCPGGPAALAGVEELHPDAGVQLLHERHELLQVQAPVAVCITLIHDRICQVRIQPSCSSAKQSSCRSISPESSRSMDANALKHGTPVPRQVRARGAPDQRFSAACAAMSAGRGRGRVGWPRCGCGSVASSRMPKWRWTWWTRRAPSAPPTAREGAARWRRALRGRTRPIYRSRLPFRV